MNNIHTYISPFIFLFLLSLAIIIPCCAVTEVEVTHMETGSGSDLYVNTIFLNVSKVSAGELNYIRYENTSNPLTTLYWADNATHYKTVTMKIGGATVGTGTMTINHETGVYPWYWDLQIESWDPGANTGVKQIDLTYSPSAQNLRVDPVDASCSGTHCVDKTQTGTYPYDGATGGYFSTYLYTQRGTYYTCGGDYGEEYDTNLSASGTFCSYKSINFNLSITPYDTSGYFEIYIYKDSPSYQYAGDIGTSTGWFTYSKTLPPGDYYCQGFVTPDDSETTYGEWLNFTMLNNCTVSPTGTISSANIGHNATQNLLYTWVVGQYSIENQTWVVDNFNESPWKKLLDHGIINQSQYEAAQDIWNATHDDDYNELEESAGELQLNTWALKKEIYNETKNAFDTVHANFNISYGVIHNYSSPLAVMGGYAIEFIPAPVIDLITAYLIIQVSFLVLFMRKD